MEVVKDGFEVIQRGRWLNGRLDNRSLEEVDQEPIPAAPPGKVHVDTYLKAKSVLVWHRGGKRAFAISKGMAFASEKEFDDLFKSY